jgi:hypothetical protein
VVTGNSGRGKTTLIHKALREQSFAELTMDEFTSFSQPGGQWPADRKVGEVVVVDTGCYTLSAIKYAADLMDDKVEYLGVKCSMRSKPKMIVLESQLSVEEVLAQGRANLQAIAA